MADTMSASADATGHSPTGNSPTGHGPDATKRDFLKLVAAASAAIGVGAIAWPMIDSMNPSSDVLALGSIDVDLAPIPVGQAITAVWRGKPIFIRHRSPEEIKAAEDTPLSQLSDPQTDADRVKSGHDQWLVVIGICTHLGCIPLGNKPTDQRGDYGGWFCPCHGSQYDTSGRVRHGPAPVNLGLPPYAFETDTKIKIG
jgi:ubiquinol-cytochrome c reductase iron-sulfur subunit